MTNRFKIPDYRYLEDLEARKRGFDFNNPEDARQMYKLLKTRENEIDSIKKYLKKVPKTKVGMITLLLKQHKKYHIGKKMKKLLNELKRGTKAESYLIEKLYANSRSSGEQDSKALLDLIRETNKKLYKIEGDSMKIVTTEQKDGKAYYLFVEPNLYGFELA